MFRSAVLLVIVLALLLSPDHAWSTTIDQAIIGQGGGQAHAGTLVMEFTVGEFNGTTANNDVRADFGYWWVILTANVGVDGSTLPTAYAMRQNSPNPFMTRTTIAYAIPNGPVSVSIGIYDLTGRMVRTLVRGTKAAGQYSVTWDGTTDSGSIALAGVYFAKFHAGPFQRTSKLVMLK